MYNYNVILALASEGDRWELVFPDWEDEAVTNVTESADLSFESVEAAAKEWLALQVADYIEQGLQVPARKELFVAPVAVGPEDLAKVVKVN